MPTYDYHCKACDFRLEIFQSIKARPVKKCPECHENALERLIGSGSGIIFRGSGFYETDYRSNSYKAQASKESSAASVSSAGNNGSASKSKDASKDKSAGNDKTSSTTESSGATKSTGKKDSGKKDSGKGGKMKAAG